MNRISYILLMVLSLWITSCVETFVPELEKSDHNLMVIHGTIISDSICPFWVNLSYTSQLPGTGLDSGFYPETRQGSSLNPRLWVEGSDGSRYDGVLVRTGDEPPFTVSGKAEYTVRIGHLNPDEKYCVKVEYQEDAYESTPAHPLIAPEIENVAWTQNKDDMSVAISVTSAAPADGKPCYLTWQSVDDWEIISDYFQSQIYDPFVRNVVEQTIDVSRGWKHGRPQVSVVANSSRYPQNRVTDRIIYKILYRDDRLSVIYSADIIQRAISKEEFEYLEIEQRQYNNMGGIFIPMPVEQPTNIHCTTSSKKALGFVGVAQKLTHKRFYIEGKDVKYKRDYDCLDRVIESKGYDECDDLVHRGYQIHQWLGNGKGRWMPNSCLDVRARGASLIKPDFWAY